MNVIDFDIKECVRNLESFGISTSEYKPKMPDMPLHNIARQVDGCSLEMDCEIDIDED